MREKSIVLFICFLFVFLFVEGCGSKASEDANLVEVSTLKSEDVNLAEVSTLNTLSTSVSQFCEDNGGTSEFRELADGNELGTCFFVDGSFCDVRDYRDGICKPGDNPIAKNDVENLVTEGRASGNLG